MTEELFKKKILEPYNKGYKAMLNHKDASTDLDWLSWMKAIEEVRTGYGEFGESLYRFLLDAGDYIAKLNREEQK